MLQTRWLQIPDGLVDKKGDYTPASIGRREIGVNLKSPGTIMPSGRGGDRLHHEGVTRQDEQDQLRSGSARTQIARFSGKVVLFYQ